MNGLMKAGVVVACVAALIGGSFVLRTLRQKVNEWKKLTAEASELRARAEKGDADAQNKLGIRYRDGKGVRKDVAEALVWYRRAAEQGHPKAQFNLSNMYHYGQGVPKDYSEAFRWMEKSADQGYAYAQSCSRLQLPSWRRRNSERHTSIQLV